MAPEGSQPRRNSRIQFLDQSELERLLAAPYPDDAFGRIEPTLYLSAAMTGLRQGELIGLHWRDVDFDARRIRVVSPYVRGEFGDPKSIGSGRSVFCHPETGMPLDRSKLVRRFKEALRRADLHKITFHELHHTFGTRISEPRPRFPNDRFSAASSPAGPMFAERWASATAPHG